MIIVLAYALGDGAEMGTLEPWHAEEFLKTIDRCREHLAPEIPAAHIVFNVDDARRYLQVWADARATDSRHLYGIWMDGGIVGCVQLFKFDPQMGTCELGVWLAPEVQGRGLITNACRHAIDWAIGTRGMRRVQWTNNPTNTRSRAVAQRLGMTREGVLRSAWLVGGVPQDSEVWSIIAGEWPTKAADRIG